MHTDGVIRSRLTLFNSFISLGVSCEARLVDRWEEKVHLCRSTSQYIFDPEINFVRIASNKLEQFYKMKIETCKFMIINGE